MNKNLLALAGAATLAAVAFTVPVAAHATDVGVSVSISQPGVYGRVDVGRFPQPVLVQPQPVIIARPVAAPPPPVYMWVPPGHRRDWRKHCRHYNACGVPVYFVQDRWYDDHVRYVDRPRHHEDRRGDWRDDRDGPGRGHGHGHGHGHGPDKHGR